MFLRNPFEDMAYLTEKGIHPEEVLERYSIKPFLFVLKYLTQKINCYAIGRTGVGKTMILSLFDSKYQKILFSDSYGNEISKDRKLLIENIPTGIISVFLNIDTPNILFTRFQGRLQDNRSWQKSFGDYIGHILLKKLLLTLEDLNNYKGWRKNSKVREINHNLFDRIAQLYLEKISKILPEFSSSEKTWINLKLSIEYRINQWIKAVSQLGEDKFTGPEIALDLIQPCLVFMGVLRETNAIEKVCRLFIIIDQYETLYEHKDFIDFRPVFNLAMRQAARGGTQIEFKIGVRPYGYLDNLKIFDSKVQLDIGRECKEVQLDDLADKYYDEFIDDLIAKCIGRFPEYNNYLNDVTKIFEKNSAIQEVKHYLGKSKSSDRHFRIFFRKTSFVNELNISKEELIAFIKSLTEPFSKIECKIWIQTLLSIFTEKLLYKKKSFEEIKEQLKKILPILYNECHDCIEECKPREKADSEEKWRYTHLKPGALFIIASAYQNKKLYSSYETIRYVSSNIVLHFIEIVSEAFILHLYEQKDDFKPIPTKTQQKAIYSLAHRYFENISDKTSYGLSIRRFLLNLGYLLREYQLKPELYVPTANGIILNTKLTKQFPSDETISSILVELLSYGFIEERELKYSKGKQYKYYVNRLLCPYFNIALEHLKNPLSVSDEHGFIKCLLEENCTKGKLMKLAKGKSTNDKIRKLDEFFE